MRGRQNPGIDGGIYFWRHVVDASDNRHHTHIERGFFQQGSEWPMISDTRPEGDSIWQIILEAIEVPVGAFGEFG